MKFTDRLGITKAKTIEEILALPKDPDVGFTREEVIDAILQSGSETPAQDLVKLREKFGVNAEAVLPITSLMMGLNAAASQKHDLANVPDEWQNINRVLTLASTSGCYHSTPLMSEILKECGTKTPLIHLTKFNHYQLKADRLVI